MAPLQLAAAAAVSHLPSAAASRLLFPSPRSHDCRSARPTAKLSSTRCRPLRLPRRWLQVGDKEILRLGDAQRPYNRRVVDMPVQAGCLSCFEGRSRRGRGHVRRHAVGFFVDKSANLFNKHSFATNHAKPAVICATLGPDEPHVASTTWSDTALEKQGLGLWDPEVANAGLEGFLDSPLPSHPKLYRGQLKNGLRYIILPNKVPANRFEAHMEVHVGSIDEEDDEQGIAHMIEHVAFLGSKKREKLLGTGARSNAYTDFHHTVFHIHSPTTMKDSSEDLLPSVLDALNELPRMRNHIQAFLDLLLLAVVSQ